MSRRVPSPGGWSGSLYLLEATPLPRLEPDGQERAIPGVSSDTDTEIIVASLQEPARFAEIFERHAPRVEAFVASRVGHGAKDDILSETFLAAFRSRQKFDPSFGAALPWLLGIASRVIRRHRSVEARHWRVLVATAGVAEETADDAIARSVERADAESAIRGLAPLIGALKPRDRELLLLYAWGDLTYAQIAVALHIPVGTVRSRLNRIRARLSSPPVLAATTNHISKIEEKFYGQLDPGA